MKKFDINLDNISFKNSSNISITIDTQKTLPENKKNPKSTHQLQKELSFQKNGLQELILLFQKRKYNLLLEKVNIFLDKFPDNIDCLNLKALAYKNLKNYQKSIDIFKKIIKIDPSLDYIYANLGNLYYDLGKHSLAEEIYKKAVEIKPENIKAQNGLGLVYSNSGNDKKAIDCYKNALKFEPNNSETNFNIATSYRKIEDFQNAIIHYKNSTHKKSNDFLLECFYLDKKGNKNKNIEDFFSLLKEIKNNDRLWPLSASLSAHASKVFSRDDIYPFCRKPFDFIKKYKLFEEGILSKKLISNFLNDVLGSNITKRGQGLLLNGEQTSGNLFLLNHDSVKEMKSLIEDKISLYRENYKDYDEGIIKKWPKKYNLFGWLIIMNKSGSLRPHMHKEGWLSSSIYLQIPRNIKNDEGSIQFSLHGGNYPNLNDYEFNQKVYQLKTGDMVMFPSSLFHSTIPYESDDQRITLAFDIIPE